MLQLFSWKELGSNGDAGAIMTNSKNLYKKCKMIANHGGLKKNSHIIVGRNSRLDNLQAGILRIKVNELKKWTNQRIQNAKKYEFFLRKNKKISLPIKKTYNKHVYHLFVVKVKKRKKLIEFLKKNKVQTSIHYPKILSEVPAFKKKKFKNNYLVAKQNSKKILSLPIGEHLSEIEIKKVSNLINKFYNQPSE